MIRHILWSSLTNVFITLITLITGVFIARLLGPEGRGIIAAAQSLPSVFAGIASLGLSQATVYYLNQKKYSNSDIISTLTVFVIPWSFIVIILCYLSVDLLMEKQSADVIRNAKICTWLVFNALAGSVYVWVFQGMKKFKYWNSLRILSSVFWLAAILAAIATENINPEFILMVFLIIPLPFVIACYIVMFKAGGVRNLTFSSNILYDLLKFGFPVLLTTAPRLLNSQFDQLFITFFLSPKLLGYYAVSLSWGGLSGFIFSAIGSVLFPVLAGLSDVNVRVRTVKLAVKTALMIALPIMLLQMLATPFIIPVIFGPSFAEAIYAATLLVISGVFIGLSNLLKEIANGLGKTKIMLYSEIASTLGIFVLLYSFIEKYQLNAVLFSSIFCYSMTFVYLLYAISKTLGIGIFSLIIPNSEEVGVIAKTMKNKISPLLDRFK